MRRDALEAEINSLIKAHADMARTQAILTSIDGLGTLTANLLIVTMPELGRLESKQAAALAGLAPITHQSGQWRGKSFVQGGRANVRRALYMPALVAARFNPDLKEKYRQLVAAGKPAKVAITVAMRNLIALANALPKEERMWVRDPA